jgi:hypothetical protein
MAKVLPETSGKFSVVKSLRFLSAEAIIGVKKTRDKSSSSYPSSYNLF